MKNFKRAASLLLAVMMIATMFSSITIASANTVVDKYEVVEYTASELVAGTTVNVTTTLERVVDTNNANSYTATVINAVYAGDELVDVDGVTKEFPFWGTTQTFNSAIAIPEGKTGLQLKTLLWDGDGYTTLKPLSVASDEAVISHFVVAGETIEVTDDTVYNIELPKGTPAEPAVDVLANGFVNTVVTYPEANVINIVAKGVNYTINWSLPAAPVKVVGELTNVSVSRNGNATALTERGVLKATPVMDTTKTIAANYGVSSWDELVSKDLVAPAWSDRAGDVYLEVPDMFVGMNYIPMPNASGAYSYAGQDTITFTTNKDVDIYYSATSAWVDADAKLVKQGGFQFKYLLCGGATSSFFTDYTWGDLIDTYKKQGFMNQIMYKKEIRLEPGETSKTVSVKVSTAPANSAAWGINTFCYVFPDETPYISDISTVCISDGKSYWDVAFHGVVKPNPVVDDASATIRSVIKHETWGSVPKNFTVAHSGDYTYIYTQMPEELVGKKYFVPDSYNAVYTRNEELTFTTSKSVRLWYSAGVDWHTANSTLWATQPTTTGNCGTSIDVPWSNVTQRTANTTIYTEDILVPEGETVTATIKIKAVPVQDGAFAFPFVVYEFIDDVPGDEPVAPPVVEKAPVAVTGYRLGANNEDGTEFAAEANGSVYDLIIPEYVQRADGNYYLSEADIDGGAIWNVLASRPDSLNYNLITYAPAEMAGAKMLFWNNGVYYKSADGDTGVKPYIKFTINQDATLYFDSFDEDVERLGAVDMDDSIKYRTVGAYDCSESFKLTEAQVNRTDLEGESSLHGGRLFKLELKVPEGQSTATFEIPLRFISTGSYYNECPIAFIK